MSSRKHPSIAGLLLKPEAVRALEVLVRAVYAAGEAVPCRRDPKAWTGDNPEPGLREGAAHLCQRCPALAECDDYATTARERWGVWGGRDRTQACKVSDEAGGSRRSADELQKAVTGSGSPSASRGESPQAV